MSLNTSLSLMSRMNYNEDYDTLYIIEEYGDFDLSIINENDCSFNEINAFLNIVNVKYEYSLEIEEKTCKMNDLKNYFDFIKIIHNFQNQRNEINVLILNNKKYTPDDILKKINEKAIFGNTIRKTLNLKKFPIVNYILEEAKNESNYTFYDHVFFLKEKKEQVQDNKVVLKILDELKIKINKIENNYNNEFQEINTKLAMILSLYGK